MRGAYRLLILSRPKVPYHAYVTNHFVGEFVMVEEVGRLTYSAFKVLREALGEGRGGGIVIKPEDVPKIPLNKVAGSDRELLERVIEKLQEGSTVAVIEPYEGGGTK